MKPRLGPPIVLIILLLIMALTSCTSTKNSSIPLASFTENDVDVSISLARTLDGEYHLSATFTPPEGYHLYSKDIPVNGVDGLGRPTLIELTAGSQVKAADALQESVKPQPPGFEPKELLVYPLGTVTLDLPIKLPAGDQWVQDELSVTYMACSASQCKPPVVGKIIPVRIPGAETKDIH